MTTSGRSLANVAKRQLLNLRRFVRGIPLTRASLGSMTLDEDDVDLARFWMEHQSNWYRSHEVEEYHRDFAKWNGSAYAFSFMGGRVALSAIIDAMGIEPGDEVILPGYTCVVVPNALRYVDVKPVYSDIELETYGLDCSLLEDKITSRTRAILVQHLYGLVCRDYEKIVEIARKRNLMVIEDCAHCTGAMFRGKRVGNLGDAAFYSSEQSKVFNTIQGGIVTTNDHNLAERLGAFHSQAEYPDLDWIKKQLFSVILNYYRFKHPKRWLLEDWAKWRYGEYRLVSTTAEEERGRRPVHYGRKMPAPVASLAINQLRKIDDYNSRRRVTAQQWDKWCLEEGYSRPLVIHDSTPVFLRYPVLVDPSSKRDRQGISEHLNVEVGVWYSSNIHPANDLVHGCPKADQAVLRCINLPCLLA